jgi:hypothetical protein
MMFKVWVIGGLTGSLTGLSFVLVEKAFTQDQMFALWEFGVAAATPTLVAFLVGLTTKTRVISLLPIAYLTLMLPVLGTAFGASGTEPLWQYGLLGLAGGLFWSAPFALSRLRIKFKR